MELGAKALRFNPSIELDSFNTQAKSIIADNLSKAGLKLGLWLSN